MRTTVNQRYTLPPGQETSKRKRIPFGTPSSVLAKVLLPDVPSSSPTSRRVEDKLQDKFNALKTDRPGSCCVSINLVDEDGTRLDLTSVRTTKKMYPVVADYGVGPDRRPFLYFLVHPKSLPKGNQRLEVCLMTKMGDRVVLTTDLRVKTATCKTGLPDIIWLDGGGDDGAAGVGSLLLDFDFDVDAAPAPSPTKRVRVSAPDMFAPMVAPPVPPIAIPYPVAIAVVPTSPTSPTSPTPSVDSGSTVTEPALPLDLSPPDFDVGIGAGVTADVGAAIDVEPDCFEDLQYLDDLSNFQDEDLLLPSLP